MTTSAPAMAGATPVLDWLVANGLNPDALSRVLPTASQFMPFVKMSYGQPFVYYWTDASGKTHKVQQGEGGEQGD